MQCHGLCMNVPFISLSVIMNVIITLVIYHHDLHGHYHMRVLTPLPQLASKVIGLLPVLARRVL